MKLLSWNVAGLRAMLKKPTFLEFINDDNNDCEIICLQETKAEEKQVTLPEEITNKYPHRYWNSTEGTTQRKGLSGTSIWCKSQPINILPTPEFDNEGRIITLEFDNFIIINVYVPNSQKLENERYYFREKWNSKFTDYLKTFQKEIIVCGDFNVAHLDIDISNPKQKKNKVAGFFDNERTDFAYLIEMVDLVDVFRTLNPTKQKSTYWSNFMKQTRKNSNGWGIDYFLISKSLYHKEIVDKCNILIDVKGSDHCPICLEINL